MKTRAALLFEPKTPLRVEELTLDEPQDQEVLVRIVASGVCHTDLHYIKGESPVGLPVVLGHEGAGIVEKVGPNVTTVEPGNHVIMTVIFSCGKCRFCIEGHPARCIENLNVMMMGTLPGGGKRLRIGTEEVHHLFGLATFAEYAVVHERSCVRIRHDAPLDVVCLLGCGTSTGIGSAVNIAGVRPGESIAIWGAGGVGLAAIMGAKLAGAGKIIAIDVLDQKLNMAKELGADFLINTSNNDPVAIIFELTGIGADSAIDCTGNVNVIAQALASVHFGGKCVAVGASPPGAMLNLPPYEFLMGKTLTGAFQGDIRAQIDIPRYVDMFMAGKLPIDKLVSRSYRLEEINDAFDAMIKGEVIRSIIRI